MLDVGSGSGYMTACFALLVGPQGHVYAIDHVKELVETSVKNIQKDNPQLLHRITTKVGDGMLGWPEHAPYDVIYVGAAAESTFHFHSIEHIRTRSSLCSFVVLLCDIFIDFLFQKCHKLSSTNSNLAAVFSFVCFSLFSSRVCFVSLIVSVSSRFQLAHQQDFII